MEKETITLSSKDQRRLHVLRLVELKEITAVEAAERLRLSLRHLRRLLKRYGLEGAAALAHGNRGRTPAVALPADLKTRALGLAADPRYAGCNDSHLTELLALREGISVSRATLRRWLRASGRPSPKKRRPRKHRKYRDRVTRFGLLLQIDTSFHRWFEDRGPEVALVGAIDDATGQVLSAHFRPQEDTDGYFVLLADILQSHGTPAALYHDGRTTFVIIRHEPPDLEDQLEGLVPQTQFARAAEELGITLIHARSPQAKGRIERLWQTFQDRLVIELRLAGISAIEPGNDFLKLFLPAYSQRFSVPPKEPESAFIPLPPKLDVASICCRHFRRTVTSDNTVSVDGVRLQLPPGPGGRSHRGARVTVQQRLDGTWAVFRDNQCLVHPAPVILQPAPRPSTSPVAPSTAGSPRHVPKPPQTHPWKQAARAGYLQKQAELAKSLTSDKISEQLR